LKPALQIRLSGNTNARYDYQQSLAAIRYQTGQ
jgi:hypothetical protein